MSKSLSVKILSVHKNEAKKAKENSEDNREFWELGAGIVLFIAGKTLESSKPVYSMVCFILAYLILGIKIVWTALKKLSLKVRFLMKTS